MASPSPPRDSLTETMTSLFDYLKADEMTLTKEDQGYYYKTLDEKVAPETRGHLKKLLDINKRYALRMEQSEEKAKAAHAQNEHHTAAMVTTSSMAAGLETDEVLRRISGGTVGGAMTSGAAINRSMTTRTEGGGKGGEEKGALGGDGSGPEHGDAATATKKRRTRRESIARCADATAVGDSTYQLEYTGDIFGTRGDYTGGLMYLSRMKTDVEFWRPPVITGVADGSGSEGSSAAEDDEHTAEELRRQAEESAKRMKMLASQENSAAALAALATNPEMQESIINDGAIQALVQLANLRDERIHRYCR